MTKILIPMIVLLILFAIWNGLVIKWYNTKDDTWRTWWHRIGFGIRFFILTVIYLIAPLLWVVASFVIASIGYNIIIAKIIGKKWFYLGTKGVDGWIRKIFKIK